MTIRYWTLTIAIAGALTLNGCGGTPSDGNHGTPDNPPAQGKGIAVCTGDDQGFAHATPLEAGKVIQRTAGNARIRIWHLSNGTRKACVQSGSAEVE